MGATFGECQRRDRANASRPDAPDGRGANRSARAQLQGFLKAASRENSDISLVTRRRRIVARRLLAKMTQRELSSVFDDPSGGS